MDSFCVYLNKIFQVFNLKSVKMFPSIVTEAEESFNDEPDDYGVD